MKIMTINEFLKTVDNATKEKTHTCIRVSDHIENESIFTATINKKTVLNFDVPQENKYDILFEELTNHFKDNYNIIWSSHKDGIHSACLIINENVVVDLYYKTEQGQNWLFSRKQSSK